MLLRTPADVGTGSSLESALTIQPGEGTICLTQTPPLVAASTANLTVYSKYAEITGMADLTETEILALARASGIRIPSDLLPEVGYSLNGLLEALDQIDLPGLDDVEPLPILIPPASGSRS